MSIITPVGIEHPGRALVRKTLVGGVVTVALASAALILALLLFARHSSTVLRVYFGLIGLSIGLSAIRRLAAALSVTGEGSSTKTRRRQRQTAPNWPAELFELEGRVHLGKVSAFDYQSRLRPLIRELASQRLAAHWQIDISRHPTLALTHLQDTLRSEVFDQPDAADPRDLRDVPGPSMARLCQLMDELESI